MALSPTEYEKLRSNLAVDLLTSNVPSQNHEGLVRYLMDGVMPGSFLSAILRNDLKDACSRADQANKRYLFETVEWLYNQAPWTAWGSPEAVAAWCGRKGYSSQ